jgi:hypothetical protein
MSNSNNGGGGGYYNNNNYHDTGEIFGNNNPFVRKMKAFFAGSAELSETYGDSYEHHLMNSNISITNGGSLWDSPHAQQQHADEQEQELRRSIGDHSVAVKRVNDDSAENERMKDDMLYTAALIESKKKRADASSPSLPLSDHNSMISVDIPAELKTAAQISDVIINTKTGSLYVRPLEKGKGRTIYMKLSKNAFQNSLNFIVKAAEKNYPDDVATALALHLQRTAFAEIARLYDTGAE